MKMDYSYYHDTRFAELDCPIDDVVATMHVDDDDRNVMVLDFDKVEPDREIDAHTLSKFLEEYYYDLEVVEIKSDNPVHLVGDASSMFTHLYRVDGCENLDVSGVTNMYGMFIGCNDDDFNPNIGEWDVSNVIEMSNMFSSCSGEHFNPDIGSWDVSNVGRMASMFADCCGSDFNPDLSEWNVSRLFDVNEMFRNCSGEAFNPDFSNWNTSNFNNTWRMFEDCSGNVFNPDVSKWDLSNVVDMYGMFSGCSGNSFNVDVSKFDTSNVRNMSYVFSGCSGNNFNPDVSQWNVSNVVEMESMFRGCSNDVFNPDVSQWNTSKLWLVTDMFNGCNGKSFNPDISSWDTSWFRNLSRMFSGCNGESFEAPDLSKVNFGRFMEFSEVEDVLKDVKNLGDSIANKLLSENFNKPFDLLTKQGKVISVKVSDIDYGKFVVSWDETSGYKPGSVHMNMVEISDRNQWAKQAKSVSRDVSPIDTKSVDIVEQDDKEYD